MKKLFALCLSLAAVTTLHAQTPTPPKPGPEVEMLKNKMVGTWETTSRYAGGEGKGTAVYSMELGGLWLFGKTESNMNGQKFMGHSMETWDPHQKKYVCTWVDSMATAPSNLSGTYDPATKTCTMTGEGPGKDGKMEKQKTVARWTDDNNFTFMMYEGSAADPSVTVMYKRK